LEFGNIGSYWRKTLSARQEQTNSTHIWHLQNQATATFEGVGGFLQKETWKLFPDIHCVPVP